MDIRITKAETLKDKVDDAHLGFGQYYTDHMFIMPYDEGQGWHDGRIVPYGKIELEPASCVLHYAQMMFEGLKAYRHADGSIWSFRPDDPTAGADATESAESVALSKALKKHGFVFVGPVTMFALMQAIGILEHRQAFS